jgi:hypothetical protein
VLLNTPLNASELNRAGGVAQFATASAAVSANGAGAGLRTRRGTATASVLLDLSSAALILRGARGDCSALFDGQGAAVRSRGGAGAVELWFDAAALAASRRGGIASHELVAEASGDAESVPARGTAELVCAADGVATLTHWAKALGREVVATAAGAGVVLRSATAVAALECDAYGVGKLNSRVQGYGDASLMLDADYSAGSGPLRRYGAATALVIADGADAAGIGRRGAADNAIVFDAALALTSGKRGTASALIEADASGVGCPKRGGKAAATLQAAAAESALVVRMGSASVVLSSTETGGEPTRKRYGSGYKEVGVSAASSAPHSLRGGGAAALIEGGGTGAAVLNLNTPTPERRTARIPAAVRVGSLPAADRTLFAEG